MLVRLLRRGNNVNKSRDIVLAVVQCFLVDLGRLGLAGKLISTNNFQQKI